jgi:hypothetical protein
VGFIKYSGKKPLQVLALADIACTISKEVFFLYEMSCNAIGKKE